METLVPGCTPDTHRWEFVEFKNGANHYRCLVCGEQMDEYQENHGC